MDDFRTSPYCCRRWRFWSSKNGVTPFRQIDGYYFLDLLKIATIGGRWSFQRKRVVKSGGVSPVSPAHASECAQYVEARPRASCAFFHGGELRELFLVLLRGRSKPLFVPGTSRPVGENFHNSTTSVRADFCLCGPLGGPRRPADFRI